MRRINYEELEESIPEDVKPTSEEIEEEFFGQIKSIGSGIANVPTLGFTDEAFDLIDKGLEAAGIPKTGIGPEMRDSMDKYPIGMVIETLTGILPLLTKGAYKMGAKVAQKGPKKAYQDVLDAFLDPFGVAGVAARKIPGLKAAADQAAKGSPRLAQFLSNAGNYAGSGALASIGYSDALTDDATLSVGEATGVGAGLGVAAGSLAPIVRRFLPRNKDAGRKLVQQDNLRTPWLDDPTTNMALQDVSLDAWERAGRQIGKASVNRKGAVPKHMNRKTSLKGMLADASQADQHQRALLEAVEEARAGLQGWQRAYEHNPTVYERIDKALAGIEPQIGVKKVPIAQQHHAFRQLDRALIEAEQLFKSQHAKFFQDSATIFTDEVTQGTQAQARIAKLMKEFQDFRKNPPKDATRAQARALSLSRSANDVFGRDAPEAKTLEDLKKIMYGEEGTAGQLSQLRTHAQKVDGMTRIAQQNAISITDALEILANRGEKGKGWAGAVENVSKRVLKHHQDDLTFKDRLKMTYGDEQKTKELFQKVKKNTQYNKSVDALDDIDVFEGTQQLNLPIRRQHSLMLENSKRK